MVFPHLFHCNSSLHSLCYSISSWTKLQKVQGLESKNNEIILVLLIQKLLKLTSSFNFWTLICIQGNVFYGLPHMLVSKNNVNNDIISKDLPI